MKKGKWEVESPGIKHMAMHKRFVIQSIKRFGAKEVFVGWQGTDEEAIKRIEADPRDWFTGCDNTAPNGECLGHDGQKKT